MTEERPTDPSTVVPLAAPLTGESPETDQPAPHEVLPGGEETEVEHLVTGEE